MDRSMLKYLASLANLTGAYFDEVAREGAESPPSADPPPESTSPATGPMAPPPKPPTTPGESFASDPAANPAAASDSQKCSLCSAAGDTLIAGPRGAACANCLATAMPLLLEHLRDSNQALRVQNGLYEAALADLDRRTRALQERMDAVLRESEALKDERDQLVAAHEAERVMRARAGLKRIAVTTDSMQLEILATNAPADRLLFFCAREFPAASILLDDQPQDVDSLAKKAAAEFMREGFDVAIRVASELGGLLGARAGAAGYSSQSQEHAPVAGERQVDADQVPEGDPSPFMPVAQLEAAPPAPSGPSLAVWREAADSEVQGLAALITHVHAAQTRLRAPLGQYTPPYHPPRLRHAARTGRKRISQWLEDLHIRGLELASGLRTAQDIARHLNPGNDVVQRAGLSPQTLVKFKAQPGDRSVETLVRIAVAMGRVDLLELRSFAVKQLPEGLGSTDSVARTIN